MRFILELIVIAAIVALAWEKPMKERLPWTKTPPQEVRATPKPTPPGAWMWDPDRRTALDTQAPNPTFSPYSWRLDPNYRSPLDPPHRSATPQQKH
jgi:hypothetical protein